ncbi:hypothetical protein AJ80_06846 [Polytolypa hystricis UAMH7299]|uniref:Uncharacterized protein n=1 Tax=Polytolypa hystricis (strain UAMH7299) TaxID=1447883 RepID=A0A2B7XT53_POLH7|nr:hypothetical protein AJ80_06846 [Polytolypa hystricis UAMH7299]
MAPAPSLSSRENDGSPNNRPEDIVAHILKTLVSRDAGSSVLRRSIEQPSNPSLQFHPKAALLMPRNEKNPVEPSRGTVDPHDMNMQGLMALFAIIGAAFVVAAIWFFFWAKNGGFIWRKGDWDEYKSTVLRRKGPDGRTLSNATKSTILGGGSVVGSGFEDYSDTVTVENSTVMVEKAPRRGLRETAKQKLLRKRRDEKWEGDGDEDVRAYRHERPARVGGLNREPDGTYHDGSEYTATHTGTTVDQAPSQWTESEIGDIPPPPTEYDYRRPADEGHAPPRNRNVSGFSFVGGEDSVSNVTEEHPLRDPIASSSRRHRERSERRESSHKPRGPRTNNTRSSRQSSPKKRDRSSMPGGYTTPLDMASISAPSEYLYEHVDGSDGENRTRTYHHPLPELSGAGAGAAGGRGYRRGAAGRGRRRDSLSESEGEDYDSRLT